MYAFPWGLGGVLGREGRPGGVLVDPQVAEGAARFQAMLLRSPAVRIEGGTDQILRNIIGERVLGLPEDMRADKGMPFNEIPSSGS